MTDKDITRIQLPQFRALVDEAAKSNGEILIADARTKDEYAASRVPGSRNLRAENLRPGASEFARLEKYTTIAIYGADARSGAASALAKRLMEFGSGKIYWYVGGMREWKTLKMPLDEAGIAEVETKPAPPPTKLPSPGAK
ncbi:MAG: rhodanese-like domain-containing protein [Planctomycetota bacterium]